MTDGAEGTSIDLLPSGTPGLWSLGDNYAENARLWKAGRKAAGTDDEDSGEVDIEASEQDSAD